MKLFPLAAVAALAAAAALPALAGPITNGGFEAGLGGWTPGGPGTAVTVGATQDFAQTPYLPTEGASFALLTAGGPDYTTISQAFTLSGASILSFDAAFLAFDDIDHNDDGFVHVVDSNNKVIDIFKVAIDDLPPQFSSTGWNPFSQLLGAGTYTLVAGVHDVGDDPNDFEAGFDSQVLVDNVQITAAPVPEPAAWALMIVGFASLGAALRARRSAAQAV